MLIGLKHKYLGIYSIHIAFSAKNRAAKDTSATQSVLGFECGIRRATQHHSHGDNILHRLAYQQHWARFVETPNNPT